MEIHMQAVLHSLQHFYCCLQTEKQAGVIIDSSAKRLESPMTPTKSLAVSKKPGTPKRFRIHFLFFPLSSHWAVFRLDQFYPKIMIGFILQESESV